MKGHDQIIAALNDVLTAELTTVNQYFIHARMCENEHRAEEYRLTITRAGKLILTK